MHLIFITIHDRQFYFSGCTEKKYEAKENLSNGQVLNTVGQSAESECLTGIINHPC